MTDTKDAQQDAALDALTTLSEVADRGVEELKVVSQDLAEMRGKRVQGWSWRQIVSSDNGQNPLAALTSLLAGLGRAGGEFRRALARALRVEGMRVTEIGGLLDVSRQRISALIRDRRTG